MYISTFVKLIPNKIRDESPKFWDHFFLKVYLIATPMFPIIFPPKKYKSPPYPPSFSLSLGQAEKRRSKMAEDGDLTELFEALEMEDDGKASR